MAEIHRWTASDGVELAYHELGEGRPVVLLHGLFSDATMNWIKFGHAERIAREGFRAIMPDLRAHGESGRPHGVEFYPKGILARDLRELDRKARLDGVRPWRILAGITDDCGRRWRRPTSASCDPRRCGLEGLCKWERRKTFFLEAIEMFDTVQRGDPHWLSIQFMKSQKVDRVAARLLLDSFEDTLHGLAAGVHHADARRLRQRGRRQRLGRGAGERPAQRVLRKCRART